LRIDQTDEVIVAHDVTSSANTTSRNRAYHASQMFARNITSFLLHLVKDGKLQLNLQDK